MFSLCFYLHSSWFCVCLELGIYPTAEVLSVARILAGGVRFSLVPRDSAILFSILATSMLVGCSIVYSVLTGSASFVDAGTLFDVLTLYATHNVHCVLETNTHLVLHSMLQGYPFSVGEPCSEIDAGWFSFPCISVAFTGLCHLLTWSVGCSCATVTVCIGYLFVCIVIVFVPYTTY